MLRVTGLDPAGRGGGRCSRSPQAESSNGSANKALAKAVVRVLICGKS